MKEEVPSEKQSRRPIAAYIGLGLGLIAAIALVYAVIAARQPKTVVLAPTPKQPSAKAVTQAPAAPPMPGKAITQAPAPAPPAPGQPAQPPPREVIDFLNDVAKIEQHRRFLLNDKGPALALLAGGGDALEAMIRMSFDPDANEKVDPFAKVRAELNRQYKHWNDVLRSFDTLRLPPSCRPFAGSYRWVLQAEAQQIGRASAILADVNPEDRESISRGLSALTNMKGDPGTQGSIDKAVDAAEAQLDALCKQFGINKPFSVFKETGGETIVLP